MRPFSLIAAFLALIASPLLADDRWIEVPAGDGPGKGKKVVLISGDEEYRSEETLPQLAKVLARRHGFSCTVLFAIDPADGTINPNRNDNIPGLEALASADLMVIFTRFRDLPDDQMKLIEAYLKAGKPVIGLRTSTHAFNIKREGPYKDWSFNSKNWEGGFGRQVLGDTWLSHHGNHGSQSTRGLIAPGAESHPILRGLRDGVIWGPTDVYGVRIPLPGDSKPIVLGQVLVGMQPTDAPLEGKKNDPMMPIAWTKTYQLEGGKVGKAFTTTMGASTDFANEGVRRLIVNACYWATGMEEKVPEKANVDLVGKYDPHPFKFDGFVKGLKPADYARD